MYHSGAVHGMCLKLLIVDKGLGVYSFFFFVSN